MLDDELRSFAVAVSRARDGSSSRRCADDDHRPSPLVDLIAPLPGGDGPDQRLVDGPGRAGPARPSSGRPRPARREPQRTWRRRAAPPTPGTLRPALLARLAAEGVPGAHPDEWYGLGGPSTSEPLWRPDALVPLSPSRLETASTCALRWALEAAGGKGGDSTEQSLGNLVHAVAASHAARHGGRAGCGGREPLGRARSCRTGWVGRGAAPPGRRDGASPRGLPALARPDVVAVEQRSPSRWAGSLLRGVVDRLERVGTTTGPSGCGWST